MLGSSVFGFADWLLQETMEIFSAAAATDFSLAVAFTDPTDAVAVSDFATVGSVYVVVASPLESVTAGFGEKVPPTPSLKLTEAPTTIWPDEFLALKTRGRGNAVPTVPVCFPPEISPRTVTPFEVEVSVKVAEL